MKCQDINSKMGLVTSKTYGIQPCCGHGVLCLTKNDCMWQNSRFAESNLQYFIQGMGRDMVHVISFQIPRVWLLC